MNTGTTAQHWADILELRPEVRASDGSVGELQMSLHKAVYQTVDVPYRKVENYGDITEPSPNFVGFFARVARRLGTTAEAPALFHLDQGDGRRQEPCAGWALSHGRQPGGVLRPLRATDHRLVGEGLSRTLGLSEALA